MAEKNELSQDEINRLLAAITPSGDAPSERTAPGGTNGSGEVEKTPEPEEMIVRGDLESPVKHPGPVTVTGRLLPGGIIDATGPVTVAGGISGGVVDSVESLVAPFIEFAAVTSLRPILVTSHILGSDVLVVEGIYCSPGTGSAVIGGRCRSFSTIQADVIGSPLGLPTCVELVLNAPEMPRISGPPDCCDPYFKRIVALSGVRKGVEATVYGVRQDVRETSGETAVFPCF